MRQKLQRNAVLDHGEQFLIEKDKLIKTGIIGGQPVLQFFVFLIEQIGKGTQQRIFSVEIMIKGTFGGLGQFNYVIYCGVVVAVLVEQLPGGGNDTALCLIGNFFHLFLV